MKRRLRTLVDVDDVVADLRTSYFRAVEQVLHRHHPVGKWDFWDLEMGLTPAEALLVDEVVSTPSFLNSLRPLDGAVEGVKELNEVSDVYFVTAYKRSSSTWVADRNLWLVKHFGFPLCDQVVHTKQKHTVWGDFFIDDKPDHVVAWLEAMQHVVPTGRAFLRDWPYNRSHDLPRFSSWPEIVSIVKEAAGAQ